MPQSHTPPEPSLLTIERPRCPKCQAGRMMLVRLAPGSSSSDLRTFECQKCEHVQKVVLTDDGLGQKRSNPVEARPPHLAASFISNIKSVCLAALGQSLLTDGVICKDLAGHIVHWDHNAERIFGFKRDDVIGKNIVIIIPHDRRAEEAMILERLNSGANIDGFETFRQTKDGSLRRVVLSIAPIRDEDGRGIAAVKFVRDINHPDPFDEATMRACEAEHRTRNILATVMATIHLSEAGSVDELKNVISGRIRALADVTSLIGSYTGQRADIKDVLTKELWSAGSDDKSRVSVEGPTVLLNSDQAQSVAMIAHELVTNSIKYGALSQLPGRLSVAWTSHSNTIELHWTETGLSNVAPPSKEGFGSRLITTVANRTLKGSSVFFWSPTGLNFKLSFDIAGEPPS
jgi:PAS domain S-box-containing protein